MSTINGLPAHALLVHFIVVLAPLTAVLAIVSAVWLSARQRLVWLVFALAVVTSILTPLTTQAGEWLENWTISAATRPHRARGHDDLLRDRTADRRRSHRGDPRPRSRGRSVNTVVPQTEPRSVGSVSRRRPRRPSLRPQHTARQSHSRCAPWCCVGGCGTRAMSQRGNGYRPIVARIVFLIPDATRIHRRTSSTAELRSVLSARNTAPSPARSHP
jgi:hypothetical protein